MSTASADDLREIAQMQNARPADYRETIELRRWFGLTESMTAAVAHHCRGKASVTLLGEGKKPPTTGNARFSTHLTMFTRDTLV